MNDFFTKPEEKVEETQPEIDKIKVGEEEYTQEELSKLVGLGKIGVEAEEKYNTKIDKIWPEFTKKTQAEKDYLTEIEELKAKQPKEKVEMGDLTPEQIEEAKAQLEKLLGGKPMTQTEFDSLYLQRRNAERLLEDTNSVIEEAKADGLPNTNVEDLLKHMEE